MAYPSNQTNPAAAIPVYSGAAKYSHINAAGNTQAVTGTGVLLGVVVNTGVSGATVTLYDGTSAAGTLIAVISAATQGGFTYGVGVTTGLFVVVAGTPDVTVLHT